MVGIWITISITCFVAVALMVFVNLSLTDAENLPFSGFIVGLVAAAGILAIVLAVFEARVAGGRSPRSRNRRRGSGARF